MSAPREIAVDEAGYVLPGQLGALAPPPPAPPGAMTPAEPDQPPAAPREIMLDDQGYIVQDRAVEKPPAKGTPSASETWALVQTYRQFGQYAAAQNVQKALVARDEETAALKALLARWEAAIGVPLETVEEIERQQVVGEAGRAAGGPTATPTPAAG
jgi:hypothetical protein